MLKKEPQRIRGFINHGKGKVYPEFYEQKINLYVRSLQYKFKRKSVSLEILKNSGIPNPGNDSGVWTMRSVTTSIRSGLRIGHLLFDKEKSPAEYLSDIHNHVKHQLPLYDQDIDRPSNFGMVIRPRLNVI